MSFAVQKHPRTLTVVKELLFDSLKHEVPVFKKPKRGSANLKFVCRLSDRKELSKPSAAICLPELKKYF
jgi:hypothetical protein